MELGKMEVWHFDHHLQYGIPQPFMKLRTNMVN